MLGTGPVAKRLLYEARTGERPLTVEDLWAVPRVAAPVPSPDGTQLALSVKKFSMEDNVGRSRIWLMPACADGRVPAGDELTPLTAEDVDSSQPAFSPDGGSLAFVRKMDPAANGQLWLLPVDGGEAECLTDLPLGASDPRWLPDGTGILFVGKLLDGHLTPQLTASELARRDEDPVKAQVTEDRVFRFWDHFLTTGEVTHLFLFDLGSREVRDLTPNGHGWFGMMDADGYYDIAPDGTEVAFSEIFVDGPEQLLRSAVNIIRLDDGDITCLTSDHVYKAFMPRYSPDGATIIYGVTEDPYFYADRVRLTAHERGTSKHTELLPDWQLSPDAWELDSAGDIFLRAERNGRVCLFHYDRESEPRALTDDGAVSIARPGALGSVYCTWQSLQQPAEVFRVETSGVRHRLTRFTDAALAGVALGEVHDINFTGAESEDVQMFLVLPPDRREDVPLPLVHVIHGGPHGITGDLFHPRWNVQLFAAPGYAVACVNFQGSTSCGQDFAQRIQGEWGKRPFDDIMAATDLLIDQGVADPERMAIAGGSYGGYLVSWLGTQTDRFKCIVNHAGVFDLLSQYATDVTQGRPRSFGGEPWAGIDAIDRWNPARMTAGLTTPMLVLHGEKDYRVPVTQGLMCYNILKAKGVEARLVYFPDENHWVLKPQNSRLWYREVHAWLERFLGAVP